MYKDQSTPRIRKYLPLRLNHAVHGRFFVCFRGVNCIKFPVGINTFSAMPKKIANFRNLPQAQEFTGHCFRRSSTLHLANTGTDLLVTNRHGGWECCEVYIDISVEYKKKASTIKLQQMFLTLSTKISVFLDESVQAITQKNEMPLARIHVRFVVKMCTPYFSDLALKLN